MKVYSNVFYAMNTRFVLVLPAVDESKGDKLFQQIKTIVDLWEKRLSRFLPEADLFKINQSAKHSWVKVSGYLFEILDLCGIYNNKTKGLFDPTYATVYDLLKKGEHQNIDMIKSQCGWDRLELNKETNSIRFNSDYMQLDFGGIGKGIALKEVIQLLKAAEINSAFLSFGESSIAAIGSHPFGKDWPIIVSESADGSNQKIALRDNCVSVSGMQNQNEKRQAHIYHPVKSKMITKHETVAVKCVCPIQAEILSTTLYITSSEEKKHLINQFPEAQFFGEI